jgi:hypothetical protein
VSLQQLQADRRQRIHAQSSLHEISTQRRQGKRLAQGIRGQQHQKWQYSISTLLFELRESYSVKIKLNNEWD